MRNIPNEKLWDHLGKREKLDLSSTNIFVNVEQMIFRQIYLNAKTEACNPRLQKRHFFGVKGKNELDP